MYISIYMIITIIILLIYLFVIYKISKDLFSAVKATGLLIFKIIILSLSAAWILLIIKLFC